MTPRVLIVEDEKPQCALNRSLLAGIPDSEKQMHGIDAFDFREAHSVASAKEALDQAAREGYPFDIMILDMGLPDKDGDATDNKQNGLEVINHAKAKRAVQVTVVLSVFADFQLIVGAFKGGVVDYVVKELEDDKVLPNRVLGAWDAVVRREADRLFRERLHTLIPYGGQGLAYLLSNCFSALAQAVQTHGNQLRDEICERHGLRTFDHGKDPMLMQLAALQRANERAEEQWQKQMAALEIVEEKKPEPIPLDGVLQSMREKVQHAFVQKRVELVLPGRTDLRVKGFVKDVEAVLCEIALGTIVEVDENAAERRTWRVEVTVTPQSAQGLVEIEWKDNFQNMSQAERSAINQNFIVAPGGRFGRAWGLSIAQHIAVRGRSSIRVAAAAKAPGTSVTLTIPSTSE